MLHLVGGVDPLSDVRRLLVDRDHDTAGVGVEAPLGVRVADLRDLRPHLGGNVDVGLGRDLAGDHDEARRDQRLARHPAGRVVGEDSVENGVGNLVGNLVRMTLRDRLRGEQEFARHGGEGYSIERLGHPARSVAFASNFR